MTSNWMRAALELARLGRARTSPNPMVGAVLERDGVAVGQGFHTYAGVKHAEILALEQAGPRARGATLYLNLEPCSHRGRTGPCAGALIDAGVARVVAAMEDPNPLVAGEGLRMLRAAGIAVEIAAEYTREAELLNEPFVHFMRAGRPLITLKSALTLDGKLAACAGQQEWITSELARAHVQQLRHEADAILTGIGTVLADDCLLTDRTNQERSRPLLRMVLDSQLRIPLDSKIVASCNSDLVIATSARAPASKREELEQLGVKILETDLAGVVEYLAREKCLSLLIEAGGRVNQSAFQSGLVDRVFFYYAPKILGGAVSLISGEARIHLHDVKLHEIVPDEFAVEAYVVRC